MSRRALIRKRIAPLMFLLGMGLIIHDTCQKQERVHATIVLGFGDAEPRVRAVDAQLLVEGDVIGELHRVALPGLQIGDARFDASMPRRDGELRIDVDLGTTKQTIVRSIRAEEGATVHVELGNDLR